MKLEPELKSKIDTLWDRFWSGGLSNPLSSIEQMSYLIFMKRLEDMDVAEENRALAKGQTYKSVFGGHEDCRWSDWKHLSATKMLPHVRDEVFPFIKGIHDGEKTRFSEQMKDAVFIIPKTFAPPGSRRNHRRSEHNFTARRCTRGHLRVPLKRAQNRGQERPVQNPKAHNQDDRGID